MRQVHDHRQPIDVRETADAFTISMRLDGADPDAVSVSGFGNTLTISGQLREEWEEEGDAGRWILRAQNFGAFERVLTLPSAAGFDVAGTTFVDGSLMVTLPKRTPAPS
jgi:HSP20 family protein